MLLCLLSFSPSSIVSCLGEQGSCFITDSAVCESEFGGEGGEERKEGGVGG